MNTRHFFRLLLAAFLSTVWCTSLADVLIIDDGSRIEGNLKQWGADQVVFATSFAGEITVDRSRVVNLETSSPQIVEFSTGERLIGNLAVDGDQQVIRTERLGEVTFEVVDVDAVWAEGEPSPLAEQVAELQEDKWSGSVGLGVSGSGGNTEEKNLSLTVDAKRETENERLILGLATRYAESDGEKTQNETIASGRLERDLSPTNFIFGGVDLETDEFENLDLRAVLSGGFGHFFVESEDLTFKGLAGLGIQHETFDTGGSQTEAIIELGYDLDWLATTWMRIVHTFRYFPTIEDPGGDYRLTADLLAEMPLSKDKAWLLKTGVKGQYDALPSPGIEQTDYQYLLNLVYSFE